MGHSEHPSSALTEQLRPAHSSRLGCRPAAVRSRPAAISWLSQCHSALLHSPANLPDRDTHHRVGPVTSWTSARELGGLMLEYARHTTDPEQFSMAIALLQQACEDGPASGEARLINCRQLATALCARFDAYGRRADLDAAISVLEGVRSVLAASAGEEPSVHSERTLLLLTRSLQRRFELTGLLCDLDRAAEITVTIHAARLPLKALDPAPARRAEVLQRTPDEDEGVHSSHVLADDRR